MGSAGPKNMAPLGYSTDASMPARSMSSRRVAGSHPPRRMRLAPTRFTFSAMRSKGIPDSAEARCTASTPPLRTSPPT